MFTLSQIKETHAKVKSGADFPKYIQELSTLGILAYTSYVSDGHAEYTGTDSHTLISDAKYAALAIASESNAEAFKNHLKSHQQGQTDYFTFCKQAAETGIEKWVVDAVNMTCTYYDMQANVILVEEIPNV